MPKLKSSRLVLVIVACILSDYVITIHAHICEVGRERNKYNEWKWVLPYPNPCECTKTLMGGMNTWTPIRPFVPVYVDSPLLSNNVGDIRQHYGLTCGTEPMPLAKSPRSTSTPTASISKETISTENPATSKASEDSNDLGSTDTSESNPTSTSIDAGTTTKSSAKNEDAIRPPTSTSTDAGTSVKSSAKNEDVTSTRASTSTDAGTTITSSAKNEDVPSTPASSSTDAGTTIKSSAKNEDVISTTASTSTNAGTTIISLANNKAVTSTPASPSTDAGTTIKSSANNEDVARTPASTRADAKTTIKSSANNEDVARTPASTRADAKTTIKSSAKNKDVSSTGSSVLTTTSARTECYTISNGRDYRGQVSVTISGKQCQRWTSQSPHKHDYTPTYFTSAGLGPHNFCRSFRGDEGVWCFTIDPAERWEFCDVGYPKPSCS